MRSGFEIPCYPPLSRSRDDSGITVFDVTNPAQPQLVQTVGNAAGVCRIRANELMAADAVLFVPCCFLSFWSFITGREPIRRILRLIVDGLFVIALSIMVVVCAVIAYAIT